MINYPRVLGRFIQPHCQDSCSFPALFINLSVTLLGACSCVAQPRATAPPGRSQAACDTKSTQQACSFSSCIEAKARGQKLNVCFLELMKQVQYPGLVTEVAQYMRIPYHLAPLDGAEMMEEPLS